MNHFNYSTQNEKDKEESANVFAYQLRDGAMKYMMIQGACLGLLLVLSLATLRDSVKCSGSFNECDKIRSNVSCKS